MPLNYQKWDQLEVSDDSDIEGHPNVDHKSLVMWRQRDIREKREARKHKITQLQANIDCDNVLLPRIVEVSKMLSSPETNQLSYFNSLVEKLEKNPSKDCPPGNDPSKLEQTYDGMLLALLRGVTGAVKERIQASNAAESEKNAKLGQELADEMAMHVTRLKKSIGDKRKEIEEEIREQNKKITSDDIHEGFDSKYVPPKPAPEATSITKPKKKAKEVTYEVLNSGAPSPAPVPDPSPEPEDGSDAEETELPQLTPSLEAFAKIPPGEYEKSFRFIQEHRDVYVPGASSDALLIAAFTAEGEGKKKHARQCVHQSLLLQYCDKLGKDGVGIFFKKMISGDKRSHDIFVNDFEKTYKHLVERVKITKEETEANSAGKEQIQLVAENPDTTINFNVPDGPPPEVIELEGPGAKDLDVNEVRKALQMRWDIFCSFPEDFQTALKTGQLEEVNKVLGDMDVPTAEGVVQQLDMAGILDFSEKGIRDATGQDSSNLD